MPRTTVVFVHGFISSPAIWDPFLKRLRADRDLPDSDYQFVTFAYPTRFLEWNPTKRIPTIAECGGLLAGFLKLVCKDGPLILVGHSMGGLVIQSMLARKVLDSCATDLQRIRSVILFATPNRGSMIANGIRSIIFSAFGKNPQEEDLRVLDDEVAETSRIIDRSILRAPDVSKTTCPIPFQAFWGAQDDIVPEVSARGSFDEASPLPGGHSDIVKCDADDPEDQRYLALKDALLNPVGHPSIYEIDLFQIGLGIAPASLETSFDIRGLDKSLVVHTDNVALRTIQFTFSDRNRCHLPYTQTYRSSDGYVEFLSVTEPNEAAPEVQSVYRSEGKQFAYVFTPDHDDTFLMKLRIYNGFGEGQRNWHDHLKPNAHYRKVRITLDLQKYQAAGWTVANEPTFYFHATNVMDHQLCCERELGTPWPPLASATPWLRTWEVERVQGGVVDLVWDVKPPAAAAVSG